MVGIATDGLGNSPEVSDGTAQIGIEPRFQRFVDATTAIFGAEYQMKIETQLCGWQAKVLHIFNERLLN